MLQIRGNYVLNSNIRETIETDQFDALTVHSPRARKFFYSASNYNAGAAE